MSKIDRLLIKAVDKLKVKSKCLDIAFISEENGKYKAIGQLWDGKKGSMCKEDIFISWHDTKDEAIQRIYELAALYPNAEDVIIFITDFKADEY